VTDNAAETSTDFLRAKIRADNKSGLYSGRVQTRFPPEPNGYLHIGHAKSIVVNFGIAADFGGECNLRFDDTNPKTEDQDFVDGIIADIEWLGFEPNSVVYASDYFEQLYEWAESLIMRGLAYVDDQDAETISEQRGGFTTPGTNSPYRERTVEENLELFRGMRAGTFPEGAHVLRA
jgi:glutaminyl-tRNA synthetase